MKSMEIKLEIKRPRKIYKLMDYFIMFGVVFVAAVLIIFLPYTNKRSKLAEAEESNAIATSRFNTLKRNEQEISKNTAIEVEYKSNYDKLDNAIEPVHNYLQAINDFAENYKEARFEIKQQTITGNVITLSIHDTGSTSELIEFCDALRDNAEFVYTNEDGEEETVDLKWISDVQMANVISANSVTVEVYYGK